MEALGLKLFGEKRDALSTTPNSRAPHQVKSIYSKKGGREGFKTASIQLDASTHSSLNWQQKEEEARGLVQQGYSLFWEIHLGPFKDFSPNDEMIFASHTLAIHHFMETLWGPFQEKSEGVSLYKGSLDFSQDFHWTVEELQEYQPFTKSQSRPLFCRDCLLEYLKRLASCFSYEVPLYLLLDASEITEETTYFQLINPEAFPPFNLIIKGKYAEKYPFAFPHLGWDHGNNPLGYYGEIPYPSGPSQKIRQALLLPQKREGWDFFPYLLKELEGKAFKVIPESLLTYQWEGIDELFVIAAGVTVLGMRKIAGFRAAGGIDTVYN